MKNNEQFELPEMEKIESHNNVINSEVGKNLDGYNNLLNNILELNNKDELLPFEIKLAKLLEVPFQKIKKIMKPANNENYSQALAF